MEFLHRLIHAGTAFLDRPAIPWKPLILAFALGEYGLESYLAWRQYRVLQRTRVPAQLQHEIDQKTYDKSQAYGRSKYWFGLVRGLYAQVKNVLVIRGDVYKHLWVLVGGFVARWMPAVLRGEITQSLVFVFAYFWLETITSLPFSYYNHFYVEEKFGFNKLTVKLWVTDLLKSQALAVIFGVPIGAAFLKIIQKTGDSFFLYIWLFTLAIQLATTTIYPILIVPLFNTLTPLPAGELKERVEALATRLHFPLAELRVIDGSRRSAHSNAYFTGLPWKKTIVLYDTLIEKSEVGEVEAVLAHELGHWSMGHTMQLMGIASAHLFWVFALFSGFVGNRSLYRAFGFGGDVGEKGMVPGMPIMIGFILFNEVLSPTDSLVQLAMNIWTRRMEFQADAFSQSLGYSAELARSLIKLQIQNLSAMDADWMYSAYHYSHPILTERLKALGWKSEQKVSDSKKPAANGHVGGVASTGTNDLREKVEL